MEHSTHKIEHLILLLEWHRIDTVMGYFSTDRRVGAAPLGPDHSGMR